MKQTIFVVEDDAALQELYAYSLENEFNCCCFDNGKPFFEALSKDKPDLILLDIMLPGDDGFMILTRLKADRSTSNIPVVIASAKGEELAKVKGLNLGADDYIAKPFGVLELVARIKANLRKHDQASTERVVYKDVTINLSRHQIIMNKKQIITTPKEFDLLCFLCKNAEKVQKREVIFREVWGSDYIGETRTIDMHIRELRKKLSEANCEVAIQTVRGVGYMLT